MRPPDFLAAKNAECAKGPTEENTGLQYAAARVAEEYNRAWWTAEAMIRQGGTFVRSLGAMAHQADLDNLSRIKATWPEYWSQYRAAGLLLEQQEKAEKLAGGSDLAGRATKAGESPALPGT